MEYFVIVVLAIVCIILAVSLAVVCKKYVNMIQNLKVSSKNISDTCKDCLNEFTSEDEETVEGAKQEVVEGFFKEEWENDSCFNYIQDDPFGRIVRIVLLDSFNMNKAYIDGYVEEDGCILFTVMNGKINFVELEWAITKFLNDYSDFDHVYIYQDYDETAYERIGVADYKQLDTGHYIVCDRESTAILPKNYDICRIIILDHIDGLRGNEGCHYYHYFSNVIKSLKVYELGEDKVEE